MMIAWKITYVAVGKQLLDVCQISTLLAFFNYDDIYLDLFSPSSTDGLT